MWHAGVGNGIDFGFGELVCVDYNLTLDIV